MTVSKLVHPSRTTLSLGGFFVVLERIDFDDVEHLFNKKDAFNENFEGGIFATMFDFSLYLYCGENCDEKLYRAKANMIYPNSDVLKKVEALKMTDEKIAEMYKAISEKVEGDRFETVKILLESAIAEQSKLIDDFVDNLRRKQDEVLRQEIQLV